MSRLTQLAVNEDGFVFDPTTGESFRCNKTGSIVLSALKDGKSQQEISKELSRTFEVDSNDAEFDVIDFMLHLRILKILQ